MSECLKAQLARTQKELEALKNEYQDFAYMVSHDLSAPLRQIEGFADIISNKQATFLDDKSQRHLELIKNGATTSKLILDSILVLSRLNTQEKTFALVNCDDIVQQVLIQLSDMGMRHNADISYVSLPVISGDSIQIKLLFFHLLHNALLYRCPETQAKINISVKEQKNMWQFSINDNGIGIKGNLIKKLFNPLQRAATNKKFKGVGMGLAIAKKIIQIHQGNIWIEMSNTLGSDFRFTLPKVN